MGEISVIQLPKGFKLVADISFEYPLEKKEKFSKVVERFDEYIGQLREECIKTIARKLGVKVEWTN